MGLALLRTLLLAAISAVVAAGAATAAGPVVLFDQGHGQRFVVDREGTLDLSGFAGAFREAGWQIRTSRGKLTPEILTGVSAVVASGPFAPYTSEEVGALVRFVRGGGRLAVMLHIAPGFENLLGVLSISAAGGVASEKENLLGKGPQDFRVVQLEKHPVTEGLPGFAVYGAWPVAAGGSDAKVIARTTPSAWIDLDRDRTLSEGETAGTLGIAVAGTFGQGSFVVFGDDALFQNRFLSGDNLTLARNLARWLSAQAL